MLKDKGGIVPTLVLTAICLVTAFLLSLTYSATKATIEASALGAVGEQMKVLFAEADTFEPVDAAALKTEIPSLTSVYEAKKGSESLGLVVQITTKGYGGDIPLMAGFKADNTLTGVKIAETKESPGIGKKIEEAAFTDQFTGKPADKEFALKPSADQTGVDQIAGATISSAAVVGALNDAVKAIGYLNGGTIPTAAPDAAGEQMKVLFADVDAFEEVDAAALKTDIPSLVSVYEAKKGSESLGLVIQVATAGYGGDIPLMAGFKADNTLSGVKIANTQETPGLGKKIEEAAFTDQFTGKPADKEFALKPSGDQTGVDQIAGATISSDAVAAALSDAVKAAGLLKK